MVKLASFILHQGKIIPMMLFFMMGLGSVWQPLFGIFLALAIISSFTWMLSYKWAMSLVPEENKLSDWFWDNYKTASDYFFREG